MLDVRVVISGLGMPGNIQLPPLIERGWQPYTISAITLIHLFYTLVATAPVFLLQV